MGVGILVVTRTWSHSFSEEEPEMDNSWPTLTFKILPGIQINCKPATWSSKPEHSPILHINTEYFFHDFSIY